ncbi:MAG: aldo/keto reductase [Myxococcota bacterium]|nr:aldo/keto reductase [Myxococcota bacterium]
MERTTLGATNLEISRIVFGSMGHGAQTEIERTRVLHASIASGATSIDTAPLYGFGDVETMLGKALAEKRNEVELLGKVGLRWDDDHGDVLFEAADPSGKRTVVRRDSRPEAIRRDVEESLVRLQTDHLDLCQIHHPDRHVPFAESAGMLERLVDEGKILQIGVSNFTGPQLEQMVAGLDHTALASDQLEYNLLKRNAEREIVPLARRHGFGLLAYSPLDAGSLAGGLQAGGVTDGRRARTNFAPRNASLVNQAIRECVAPIAERHGATPAQIALAWLLHREAVASVVAGASTTEQAQANAQSSEIRLEAEEVDLLDQHFAALRLSAAAGLDPRARARRLLRRVSNRLTRLLRG